MMKDLNEVELKNGDIIDLHQTVNGQNLFVVLDVTILDIRYMHDLSRIYEYDKSSLLESSPITFEVEWEIIGNASEALEACYKKF